MNKRLIIIGLLISLAFLLMYVISSSAANSQLGISFIDVGQGDSALIRDSSGFDVLIDGGKAAAGPTVVAYILEQGVDDIDVMVASHGDSDHIGGLIDVLEASDIQVEQVIFGGYPHDTDTWFSFATAVANEGLSLTAAQFPQSFTWGDTTAHILNPAPGLINPETNDASVVVLLDYGDIQFLFPGDIDSTIEATVVARGTPVASEFLKVPHHGSKYGSSAAFLSAVQPAEAIISVGENSYGHPSEETIARLIAAGARVWRTDQGGTVIVTSDGYSYSIHQNDESLLFLPVVLRQIVVETPTPTPTQPPTPTPTPTQTEPPATTGNVVITDIFYDSSGSNEPDEYVEIVNDDSEPIQLLNWTLRDIADHEFTFPDFVIQPDQTCRVYTNEDHPDWCGFNYGSGSAIWNNSGDTAYLKDADGTLIDEYSY